MRYRLNVISHRVTLNLKLRQGPNRGMSYKPDVRVSLREYGILDIVLRNLDTVLNGYLEYILMLQTDLLASGKVFNELNYCSIMISC